MTEITIGGRLVGPAHKPFIIAEMSGNHNQSLDRALALLDAAAAAGVDALKLQTYTADTISMDTGFAIAEGGQSLWEGRNLYRLYQAAHALGVARRVVCPRPPARAAGVQLPVRRDGGGLSGNAGRAGLQDCLV